MRFAHRTPVPARSTGNLARTRPAAIAAETPQDFLSRHRRRRNRARPTLGKGLRRLASVGIAFPASAHIRPHTPTHTQIAKSSACHSPRPRVPCPPFVCTLRVRPWCPAIPNNGETAASGGCQRAPAETGEPPPEAATASPAVDGRTARQTAGYPTGRLDPQPAPRLIETGARQERRGRTFHCARTEPPPATGQACEQCRRRPRGRNGCEEDDRSSCPQFRSAPTDRQASVGRERYLQHRRTLVPIRPTRLPVRTPSCPSAGATSAERVPTRTFMCHR